MAGVDVGMMQTRDGRWRVQVGGVGSIVWYRLVGPEVERWLPGTSALIDVLTALGIDPADLIEVSAAA